MRIGPHLIGSPVVLAPMAGVTDRPFRLLARRLGAGLAASEMTSSNPATWSTAKSRLRTDHRGEPDPRMVQIAGGDPASLAEAARVNVAAGAAIIDINMGCPCKKVCNKAAGSALLRDEELVARILDAVVRAVDVPVTLKLRTGWSREARNGVRIAKLAEDAGIQALAVHGRTRADMFEGAAEHATTAAIVQSVKIPVIANGDVATPAQARAVLEATGAAAVMVGRAAQGNPWIFREIAHYLSTGDTLAPPTTAEVREVLTEHLEALYGFYGQAVGLRVARKHIGWYCAAHPGATAFRTAVMTVTSAAEQLMLTRRFFSELVDAERAA